MKANQLASLFVLAHWKGASGFALSQQPAVFQERCAFGSVDSPRANRLADVLHRFYDFLHGLGHCCSLANEGLTRVLVTPNVRAKRATTAGRQARAGENEPRTARPGLVACRCRSA